MKLDPQAMAHLATGGPSAYRIAADWLLERGDERGEYILDELLLAERPNPSTRRAALARRAAREVSTLHPRIEAPLRALGVTDCAYHWGFVQRVRLPEKALTSLPKLLELEPITQLRVELSDGAALAGAMRSPAFSAIRGLDFVSRADPVLTVTAPQIETLTLRAGPALMQRLSDLFPALKRLNLEGRRGGSEAVEAVAAGRLALEHLWAPLTGVSSSSVMTLARSSRPIQSLGVAFNDLSASALKALGASEGLSALKELDVRDRYSHNSHSFLTTGLPALKKLRVTAPSVPDRQLYQRRGISLH